MPLPVPKPANAWQQRLAALLPTRRLPAVTPSPPAVTPSPPAVTPSPPAVTPSPPAVSRRRPPRLARWGLIVLIAVVILAGAGGVLYKVSHAAQDAALQLCSDMTAGQYDAAYGLLGAEPRAQVSRAGFVRIGAALDALDGRVTACTATAYDYALGSGHAALNLELARANGERTSGQVALDDEHGWKVAALDPALTGGAALGALDVALRFCDALRAGDGSQLLGLSDAGASAGLGDAQQLAAHLSTWQQVDGPVAGCALAGTGGGAASATAARLTLSVTRARRGPVVAALSLARQAQGWRVTAIGANLLGSDLGPLAVGQRFCTALASGNYAAAYALFSPTYAAQVTLDQFTTAFAPLGGTWSCVPQLNTYAVTGDSGSYDVALTLSGADQPLALTVTLVFARGGGGAWAIQNVEPRGP